MSNFSLAIELAKKDPRVVALFAAELGRRDLTEEGFNAQIRLTRAVIEEVNTAHRLDMTAPQIEGASAQLHGDVGRAVWAATHPTTEQAAPLIAQLKAAREAQGLTTIELADRLGLTTHRKGALGVQTPSVENWEEGRSEPSTRMLARWAWALGLTLKIAGYELT